MPQSDETARLRSQWNALFDRVFEAGRKQGEDVAFAEIEKMARRSLGQRSGHSAPDEQQPISEGLPPPASTNGRLPYGAAKNAVRKALAMHRHGITKPEIQTWCAASLEISLKMDSITEALKTLARDGEAENPERGKWIPGPNLDRGKLGAPTPSSISSILD